MKIDDKRRDMLRPYLRRLIDFIRQAGDGGLSIHKASKQMAGVQGFSADLKNARATLSQMVTLFPEIRIDRRKGHQVFFLSDNVPPPRAGTLDAFGT